MRKVQLHISMNTIISNDGKLTYLQKDDLPFEIKRVYFVYGVEIGMNRGYHAHKNLRQLLICTFGKIEILVDDGHSQKAYLLDSPNKILYIGAGIWHEMSWLKQDSVLTVFASNHYEERDYIRSYKQFKKLVQEGFWSNNHEDSI